MQHNDPPEREEIVYDVQRHACCPSRRKRDQTGRKRKSGQETGKGEAFQPGCTTLTAVPAKKPESESTGPMRAQQQTHLIRSGMSSADPAPIIVPVNLSWSEEKHAQKNTV